MAASNPQISQLLDKEYPAGFVTVCATRDPRLFAAVPLWNENHPILNASFRDAVPAHGAMPTQA
jgi:hypothetical protein